MTPSFVVIALLGALPVPLLPAAPAMRGTLDDLKAGASVEGARGLRARVGARGDTVFIAAEVPSPLSGLSVSLHFPAAGPTAPGYTYAFGPNGLLGSSDAPDFARRALKSQVVASKGGFSAELALGPQSLPRWPAKEPMQLEVCFSWDVAADGGRASVSTCSSEGPPHVVRLPDEVRKAFHVGYPEGLVGVERVDSAWLGYGPLHLPLWVLADQPLSPTGLTRLVTSHPNAPEKVHLALPDRLQTPDGRPIFVVIAGLDPNEKDDACDGSRELRIGLYTLDGNSGKRLLEWPVADCVLGRAASVVLEPGGELTIGYTNGATTTFIWSGDHFEQTQLGALFR